ncbi:kunitz-type protease inhibitor 1-like [Simochromis diagramma]|uniref:kunitz-type protease inhibitor 1-like n=1 Tax=Simochromis diagramma TaxID=43689 RepID=UPI001A7E8FB3|nr:kunitz-type protease inhibitor 1-like [Simochromis diagramma]
MSTRSSSSPPLLLLVFALLRSGGAVDPHCEDEFRRGHEDFVLYAEDAVKQGAVMLATASFYSELECERACCGQVHCNLALLEPSVPGEENRTCVLFNCVRRNRFACRFVTQSGYKSYVRDAVYRKYLAAPQKEGKKHPPVANAGRDVTIQPGETVMLNGTESVALSGAKIKDYRWSLERGDSSVKIEETNYPDQVQLSNLQTGSYVFKLTVNDSNGKSDDAKVTVLVLNPQQTSSYCQAPVKVGPCRAKFTRWRYNITKGVCEMFVFGGCIGNENNFLSEQECLSACRGVTVSSQRSVTLPAAEVCGSPCGPDQLTCGNGCCLERSMECDNVKQCSDGSDESQCHQLNQTLSLLLDIDVNKKKAQCTEPPRTGPCRAKFPGWYYDPLDQKCHEFTYGGCDRNENNFPDDQTCREYCKEVGENDVFARGLFERFDKEVDDDSSSITLAVILSVAILSLLAILAYCFLRARKRRTHRPVNTGPTHEALSKEETSVYNSTTKPM